MKFLCLSMNFINQKMLLNLVPMYMVQIMSLHLVERVIYKPNKFVYAI